MANVSLSVNDSIAVKTKATLSISVNEYFLYFGIICGFLILLLGIISFYFGRKETCLELGKSSLNISVGVVVVGMLGPSLAGKTNVNFQAFEIGLLDFLIFTLVGSILLFIHKKESKEEK